METDFIVLEFQGNEPGFDRVWNLLASQGYSAAECTYSHPQQKALGFRSIHVTVDRRFFARLTDIAKENGGWVMIREPKLIDVVYVASNLDGLTFYLFDSPGKRVVVSGEPVVSSLNDVQLRAIATLLIPGQKDSGIEVAFHSAGGLAVLASVVM